MKQPVQNSKRWKSSKFQAPSSRETSSTQTPKNRGARIRLEVEA
jgi:hypothetical protein